MRTHVPRTWRMAASFLKPRNTRNTRKSFFYRRLVGLVGPVGLVGRGAEYTVWRRSVQQRETTKEKNIMAKCGEKTEVYSRVTGYFRPVANWNKGKKAEFVDRKMFKVQGFKGSKVQGFKG